MKCAHCGGKLDIKLMTANDVELSVRTVYATHLKWNAVYRCRHCNELSTFHRVFAVDIYEMAYQKELKLYKERKENE